MMTMNTQPSKTNMEHYEVTAVSSEKDDVSDIKTELETGVQEDARFLAVEKSLTRKLDLTLLPMLWTLYLFNYLDRNNIAQAKLDSFEKDLGLRGNQFNIAVSILNVGYMLMQLPSNMLLTRVRPSLYLPAWTALWSCISATTAAAHSFPQLIAIRFLLGIAEAPFFPGAMFLLSCWYPRKQLALRAAILYSGLILATAFSGLIAAGVFAGLDDVRNLAGWQWLFLLEGGGSFLAAIVAVFVLPDFPSGMSGSAKWLLTDEEKKVAVERMERDRVSENRADTSVLVGLKLACKDLRTWVFVVMLTANHSAYGFNSFFPSIVKGFKLGDNTKTLILTAPPYLLAAIIAFLVAMSSDRRKERGYHIALPMLVSCTGFIISVATLNKAARYTAAFLYIAGCFSSNALVFSWASNSLSQTAEKRACATAIINLLSQLGNIWSPYFFPASDSPRYVMAMLLMMASTVVSMLSAGAMKFMLFRANKKLKAEGATSLFML